MHRFLERLALGALAALVLATLLVAGCKPPVAEDSKDVSGEEAAAKAKSMLESAKQGMGG